MRIISGFHKGRKILAPKKLPVRPTTDMAKEALFNILNNRYYFEDISVLDLFAGTGNISYEFLSRGCTSVVAVESHYACIKFMNEIAEKLELPLQTIKSDVFKYLEQSTQQFDVIFADPPYDFSIENFVRIADLVFENKLLSIDGSLIIEHSKHTDLSSTVHYVSSKNYGGSVFSFFK
ncbi:MAG: 16S rRNA (guanine(966)-N(2))-methyltransferase RsmD [Flavobacteriaceae bacterium]|nr:16S rRNA (guanine(966)-N(2))-methyltransferase RsmD [Flavobacteriaceae bacterium]